MWIYARSSTPLLAPALQSAPASRTIRLPAVTNAGGRSRRKGVYRVPLLFAPELELAALEQIATRPEPRRMSFILFYQFNVYPFFCGIFEFFKRAP
jgi:hypothetical protein